jgi:hypothetical protein
MGGPGSGPRKGSGIKHLAPFTTYQKSRMNATGVKVKKIANIYKGGQHGVSKGIYKKG